ncbi:MULTISPECIES: hypothetical protein [Bacillus]|uniref:hypothetical protein n=1 Tax=Bacillus TaxID=1386 RepID=UPI0022816F9D|nr:MULTISPECIES: hypothetical protein [Bacillus]MCY7541607.1 hypothetical protein [Bacillus safensis]MCY7551225.1 hypothetical protein [Bacillus safensis]MCY7645529.1 hypothetical protein [Bacillus safensis]MCY7654980.1 hypothetical protein [Bacillus safensis]MEC3710001.1 hypothetical protein [Bacillus safensis]
MQLMRQGWSVPQIDEMDYPFYIELLEHLPKMESEIKEEESKPKVVPIDKVF